MSDLNFYIIIFLWKENGINPFFVIKMLSVDRRKSKYVSLFTLMIFHRKATANFLSQKIKVLFLERSIDRVTYVFVTLFFSCYRPHLSLLECR